MSQNFQVFRSPVVWASYLDSKYWNLENILLDGGF